MTGRWDVIESKYPDLCAPPPWVPHSPGSCFYLVMTQPNLALHLCFITLYIFMKLMSLPFSIQVWLLTNKPGTTAKAPVKHSWFTPRKQMVKKGLFSMDILEKYVEKIDGRVNRETQRLSMISIRSKYGYTGRFHGWIQTYHGSNKDGQGSHTVDHGS